ncbi:hypothetical protein JKP88DRAFT_288160 [Tribonema minus]|uniref:diacylglycerol O-acyltransferase n=1 Tax=Tribonema minus TaxID=303371 RepID=A0A836CLB1_9STRA|nr:hypothetical protein JKP88DRAFT_288160 [Tribonema minus]
MKAAPTSSPTTAKETKRFALAPLTVALAASPFPLCCVGARTLSPLPLVIAWWLAYTRSVRDQWGAACGLWLALLITAWGMKAAAFAAAHATAAAARAVPLRAWLRFQFLSPHLVWDAAALPRRAAAPLRAAAEVAHAAPSFLVAHVLCLRYLAPALRALAAAAAARDAAAGAAALAALAATCLPMRAVAFYGFWHCCGCALAYLSGEPDFNLYGPWWLVRDHPAPFFRHWSRPVHVWMRRCVCAPLRRRRARPAVAAAAAFAVSSALHEAALLVALRSVWPISSVNLLLGAALTPVFAPLFGARAPAAFELLLHLGNVQFVAVTWRWWLAGFGGSGGSGGGGDGA